MHAQRKKRRWGTMADFDFDELDKAVSGALGKKTPVNDDRIEAVIVPEPETVTTPEVEPEETPSDTPKIISLSTPVQTARSTPAARRSSGRFMDMVHPRSDMTPKTSESLSPKPQPQPISTVEPTPAPIEPLQSIEEILKPLESPFLPDTKVEKRPLGGSSSSQFDTSSLTEEPILNRLEAPDDPRLEAENMPDPIDFAIENGHVDLDLEMDTKAHVETKAVVESIPEDVSAEVEPTIDESAIDNIEATEAVEEVEAVKAIEPVEQTPAPKNEGKEPAPSHSEATELIVDQPTGPTSITQQYTEQKSSTAESGAIFDTEAYHQPLAQSVKKKSGLLVIVWIVLLVVLGAAAGGAFYIYVLPML